jgi:Protein of unknown function DUF262/Protein of unknown function (DUF1524)
MKPETRTVTQLFELNVRYVVPLYQRPYVWDRKDQWEPLWEDLRTLIEHQLDGGSWAANGWSHFLGAIVLDQETQAPGSIPVYTIIDGQQRLTTLQILLAAAADVARAVGAENESEILRELVENNRLKTSGDEIFKVWPTNANRRAFKAVVQAGGPPPDHEDDPDNLIDEAYEYFTKVLKAWVSDDDAGDHIARAKMLRVTLCDLLKVVSITLESGDNAQIIFETLNARGTPLLALDLVKNAVFHEASRQGLPVDELYNDVWRPQLDDDYWRERLRQGRLYRPRAELFLMHWLGMKLRGIVPATELFATFRPRILQAVPPPRMDVLIRELCRDAKILRSFEHQEPGSVEALFFERLANLDTTTVMPLALLLFTHPAVSPWRRRTSLRILESWLVRRALMRLTPKNYNQQVASMLEKVDVDPEFADAVILDHLRSAEGEATRWPTDADLRTYLQTHDAYGNVSQNRLEMVFAAIERRLYTSKVEALSVPSGLSIEHILPQSWEETWPLPADLGTEERDEVETARWTRLHQLGNLTITAFPLNAALSNLAWEQKQVELNRHSKLLLNQRLLEQCADSFDVEAIEERTEWLVDRICEIWPGPDAATWHEESVATDHVSEPASHGYL